MTNSAFVSEVAELGVASTARTTEVINRSAEIITPSQEAGKLGRLRHIAEPSPGDDTEDA